MASPQVSEGGEKIPEPDGEDLPAPERVPQDAGGEEEGGQGQ